MAEFKEFGKIPRLFRDCIITEKIDGTNAAVVIEKFPMGTHMDGHPTGRVVVIWKSSELDDGLMPVYEYVVSAQSRTRIITPDNDNYGFAKWVYDNAHALAEALDEGVHFGEWWGGGIQRKYGLAKDDKRFSLFNVKRWEGVDFLSYGLDNVFVVPVLYIGEFSDSAVNRCIDSLRWSGSAAVRGFMDPEGVIIYHSASNGLFKVTVKDDEKPKGSKESA